MAKQVIKKDQLTHLEINNLIDTHNISSSLQTIYSLIDSYRNNPDNFRSLIISVTDVRYKVFKTFEKDFWKFLQALYLEDSDKYTHDSRVSSNPKESNFSFSLKEEAFFILALHPESPRFSRRFQHPSIVFNIHQQFETLRAQGVFSRIRNIIRKRDKNLQGSINPMLKDFGEKSEIFQYLGRSYPENAPPPLTLRTKHEHYQTTTRNKFYSEERREAQSY
jgi:FPC/CPF motif-containing protein YcgG